MEFTAFFTHQLLSKLCNLSMWLHAHRQVILPATSDYMTKLTTCITSRYQQVFATQSVIVTANIHASTCGVLVNSIFCGV